MGLETNEREPGFFAALIGDGRPLLSLTGIMLILFGLFALFLSATKNFLPHDEAFLGMKPMDLCAINECRIVHFMIHDRVAFGGTLIAIGTLYLWLAAFPLKRCEPWAWWTMALSGLIGFGSFMLYMTYGYLDTWHGVGTLGMLPIYGLGMARSYSFLQCPARAKSLLQPAGAPDLRTWRGIGRLLLQATAFSIAAGGFTILLVGTTSVFVPQDLTYMNISVAELNAINPRLVPLIAHDRVGFGGGVFCCGVTLFFCLWCNPLTRNLWQATLIAGLAGFSTAIFVHLPIGYTDMLHLAPAVTGGLMLLAGLMLTRPGREL